MGAAELFEPIVGTPLGHVLAFVLGALFGSFANVCIYRMPPTEAHPEGRSIAHPPSHCPACQHPIAWYDNVPLLAYAWLRGRCRHCRAGFSPRYLLVEGATALLFVAVYHLAVVVDGAGDPVGIALVRFAIGAAFAFVLVVITFIDLDHKLILDRITYPAIPLFYVAGLALPERGWLDGLIGAAVGYGVVRGVSDGYYLLTRRRGMGYGDGKLLAIVGAWLGWQAVFVALFAGSLIGTLVTLALIAIRGRPPEGEFAAVEPAADAPAPEPDEGTAAPAAPASLRHLEIPFGPFLAAGALLYLFLEPWLRVSFAILYS
jgi:leader peptidase (prepilin peptidase)/N-methyltransferase